jgi:hypothetical protein
MRRLASDGCGFDANFSRLSMLTAVLALGALGTGCFSMAQRPASTSSSDAPRAESRPGLGTVWGENHYAPVHNVSFERQSPSPAFLASLLYNDAEGAAVLQSRIGTRYQGEEPLFRSLSDASDSGGGLWGGVIVRVIDDAGRSLPAYHLGERVLLIGESEQRYAIEIDNRTSQRFEVVASVDGLDVVDGRTASLEKSGYIVAGFSRLRIDGYRRNLEEVAAFRFGSVRDSYANQTAELGDRHVGVIGVALFTERGAAQTFADSPSAGLDDEAARREQANPFPNHFASAPPAP